MDDDLGSTLLSLEPTKPSPSVQLQEATVASRHMSVVKDPCPASLDDVVRRHRNQNVARGFQVVEIQPTGLPVDMSNTLMSAGDLGIPWRDASLFNTDQKSNILIRNGSILFKSEAIRAVINTNKAYVIKTKPYKNYINMLEPLTESLKTGENLSFELNVLEGLLYITNQYFDVRHKQLKSITDSLVRDVTHNTEPFAAVYNDVLIQQLAPVDKAITSMLSATQDIGEVVHALLDSDDDEELEEICLSYQRRKKKMEAQQQQHHQHICGMGYVSVDSPGSTSQPPPLVTPTGAQGLDNLSSSENSFVDAEYNSDPEQARRMLEFYDREFATVEGKLSEMKVHLEMIRESWSMKLDSARNHIILLNLKMTLASLCLMLATFFPSLGGMNINHGLPDEPYVFWCVAASSALAGLVSYPIASKLYRQLWKERSQQDLLRYHTVRTFLVDHLDDLDDVLRTIRGIKAGKMDRKEFEHYMREQMPAALWKRASLDFIFQQYDTNKDGFLESIEIHKKDSEEKRWEATNLGHLTATTEDDQLYEDIVKHRVPLSDWLRFKWRRWTPGHHIRPVEGHVTDQDLPVSLPPYTTRNQQPQTWLKTLMFGPPPLVESRPTGTFIRH